MRNFLNSSAQAIFNFVFLLNARNATPPPPKQKGQIGERIEPHAVGPRDRKAIEQASSVDFVFSGPGLGVSDGSLALHCTRECGAAL